MTHMSVHRSPENVYSCIDSPTCIVNMCVLGEKSCFKQNSVFHSIDF